MTHSFVCAMCGGKFDTERDQGEAVAERDALFAGAVARGETFDEVCDECWKRLPCSEGNRDCSNDYPRQQFFGWEPPNLEGIPPKLAQLIRSIREELGLRASIGEET